MFHTQSPRPLRISASLCLSLLACVSLQLGAPGSTYAQGSSTHVAVLNLEGAQVDAKLLDTLTAVLRNEAQQYASYDIVNQSPINLSEVAIVLGCDSEQASCLARAAEQLSAQALIYGRVARVENTYQVTIEVFDASSKKVVRRLVRTLDPRQNNDADPVIAFRKQVQTLFDDSAVAGEARRSTLLHVASSVDGTEIKLNGVMVGEAPLKRTDLPAGTYRIEAQHPGYEVWTTTVELSPGADAQILATLVPSAGAPPAVAKNNAPARSESKTTSSVAPPPVSGSSSPNWGAWSAIGVGGAALVGGGMMAILLRSAQTDLDNLDADRDTMNRDKYLTDRANIVENGESYEFAQWVLLGVGAASVTAGTIWLLVDGRSSEAPGARAQGEGIDLGVSPTGVSATLRW